MRVEGLFRFRHREFVGDDNVPHPPHLLTACRLTPLSQIAVIESFDVTVDIPGDLAALFFD